jgi:hypothetical protein
VCDATRVNQGKDVYDALAAFVRRIDDFEPDAAAVAQLSVTGLPAPIPLSGEVVRALIAALGAYHDPRDRGECEHCGGHRLDDNFLCRDCGRPNGVFGAMLAERAARYEGDPAALAEFTWGEPKPTEPQGPVSLPTMPPPFRFDED